MEIECDERMKRVFMCATEPKWRQNVLISSSVSLILEIYTIKRKSSKVLYSNRWE